MKRYRCSKCGRTITMHDEGLKIKKWCCDPAAMTDWYEILESKI